MARHTSINYTNFAFTWGDANADAFVHTDVQLLAQAVEAHDHTSGKGLATGRVISALAIANPAFSGTATGTLTNLFTVGFKVRAYGTAVTSIPNTTTTAATLAATRFDTNTFFSAGSPTRITINHAGCYIVSGHGQFAGNSGGSLRAMSLRVNGATTIASNHVPVPGTNAVNITVATVYQFSAADYVELVFFQDSGGALNVNNVGNYTPELAATYIQE